MMVQLPDNEKANMTMMTATLALSRILRPARRWRQCPGLTRKRFRTCAESGGERFQKVENDIGSATGANITRYWSGRFALMQKRWRNVLRVKWVNP